MSFLDYLRQVFGDERPKRPVDERARLAGAWEIDREPTASEADSADAAPAAASDYDRTLWIKKLRHLLSEKLPIADAEWNDFVADAHALGFDDLWVDRQKRLAFDHLVRAVVADGVITAQERHKLELARLRIDLSLDDARSSVASISNEARQLLGHKIQRE